MNPYENPAHAEWIASGHCPVISATKSWCMKQNNHEGMHGSPLRLRDGSTDYVAWDREWTEISFSRKSIVG